MLLTAAHSRAQREGEAKNTLTWDKMSYPELFAPRCGLGFPSEALSIVCSANRREQRDKQPVPREGDGTETLRGRARRTGMGPAAPAAMPGTVNQNLWHPAPPWASTECHPHRAKQL